MLLFFVLPLLLIMLGSFFNFISETINVNNVIVSNLLLLHYYFFYVLNDDFREKLIYFIFTLVLMGPGLRLIIFLAILNKEYFVLNSSLFFVAIFLSAFGIFSRNLINISFSLRHRFFETDYVFTKFLVLTKPTLGEFLETFNSNKNKSPKIDPNLPQKPINFWGISNRRAAAIGLIFAGITMSSGIYYGYRQTMNSNIQTANSNIQTEKIVMQSDISRVQAGLMSREDFHKKWDK